MLLQIDCIVPHIYRRTSLFTKQKVFKLPQLTMTNITWDLDPCDEVFGAIQLIVNAYRTKCKSLAATENERDKLLAVIKNLGIQDALNDDRRKRVKIESPVLNESTKSSPNNVTTDDLNAAFSASMCDDDVIGPTQFDEDPIRHKSPRKPKAYNKENDNIKSPIRDQMKRVIVNETSPRVFGKPSMKRDSKIQSVDANEVSKSMSILNVSPKWQSKTIANFTPRRFLESKTDKNSPSRLQYKKSNASLSRRKPALCSSTTRLKQSTLTFGKHDDDETYCEEASIRIDGKQPVIMAPSPSNVNIKTEPKISPRADDSVIVLSRNGNETIIIEESQPTQELFKHVLDIKNELPTQMGDVSSHVTHFSPLSLVNRPPINKQTTGCPDCDQYHEMLGRNLEKNPPKKYGVCSKHYRNVLRRDTPPGFWNPKIQDTDSDEETPYDPRYARS